MRRRPLMLLCFVLGSCDPSPCRKPLDQWCLHSEEHGGPVDGPACEPASYDPDHVAPCGDRYEVSEISGGYSGRSHFFEDGEHVGTTYWTDINKYCGGFNFWYGRRIKTCEE